MPPPASSTATPAARRRSRPRPSTSGFGSPMAQTTRAMPAASSASAHGRLAAVVAAGLERDVGRRAHDRLAAGVERVALGVRLAAALVPALAEHAAVARDHAADERVRARAAASALGQVERAVEQLRVALVHASATSAASACQASPGRRLVVDRRARHHQVRAGRVAARDRRRRDAAVDLEAHARPQHRPQLAEAVDRGLDELLAAPAGVDRHAEQQVGLARGLAQRRGRRRGIERRAGRHAELVDQRRACGADAGRSRRAPCTSRRRPSRTPAAGARAARS